MCVCDTFSWCFPWKFSSSHLAAVVAVNDILNSRHRCERFRFEASKQEEIEERFLSWEQQPTTALGVYQISTKKKKSFEWRRKKTKIEWKVWFFSTIFIFHSFLVQKFLWSVCVGFGSFYIMLKNLFFPPLFQWIDVKQNFEVEIDSRRNWESDGQHETAQPAWMKIFLSSIYEKKAQL